MDPTIPKYRNNSSGGFTKIQQAPAQNYRPNNHNNNNHPNNSNNNGNNNNTNTAPRTGSNAIPVTPKDKSTVNCYECGVVGHYSNECPKNLAKIAANTAAPAQQQRRSGRNQNNNNGRLYHMTPLKLEAPQTMPMPPLALTNADHFDRGKTLPWLGMASSCHHRLWSLLDCTSMSWTSLYLYWISPCPPLTKATPALASTDAPRTPQRRHAVHGRHARARQDITSPRRLSAPLDLSFHLQPHLDVSYLTDNAAWTRLMTRKAHARWEPQVEGVMRTAASFPQ
ncbi:hypothetical protein QYE76_034213 [Lolium multiflorum]|uniref:CCHC-type domain-containing protein n=1 Tax=Lolium multiflorum TaxID=4521 RepID=A0AAD8QY63_LOLMU|nr:hypothetical protein QYE76_034213 [Lolium multiflorum]